MWLAVLFLACAHTGPEVRGPGGSSPSTSSTTSGSTTDCDLGLPCHPIPVDAVPFVDVRDTTEAPGATFDSYGCAPDVDEGGPEWWYAVEVTERSILSAVVEAEDGADIDVHLLADVDADACVARDHVATSWVVEPGTWYVVADTWVGDDGAPLAGGYTLTVDLLPLESGPCAFVATDLRMFWDTCGEGLDCDEQVHTDGETYPFVHTPSVGPVVKEAHLVTTDEDFPGEWPTSFTDEIDRHYALSEGVSGWVMDRTEPWAPAGEGGSEYGQGSTGAKVPADAEAWYVNMYWRDRPSAGTRMILVNPFDGSAVVTAAGYETGPGDNTALGGAAEEIHDVLGTSHREPVVMGFPADGDLPLGPIDCW